MTWKERRTVTVLSIILLVLMAALLVVLGIRYQNNRAEEEAAIPVEGTTETIPEDTFVSLSYDNGSTALSFTKIGNEFWQWDANADFPLDETVLSEILAALTAWAPQHTLTDAEALEASDLDNPKGHLTATTAAGKTMTLLFGAATADNSSRYVRLNRDESTVYLIDDTLYQNICIPIYDMCRLPELPTFTEERILSVLLVSPDEENQSDTVTVLSAQHTEGGQPSWRASGANVTDDLSLRAFFDTLETLSFSGCVDFFPSDEAASLCGFDSPAARIKILYLSEGNTEQQTDLIIGDLSLDISGRYIRYDDQPAIYLLPSDQAVPLVTLAQSGLDK